MMQSTEKDGRTSINYIEILRVKCDIDATVNVTSSIPETALNIFANESFSTIEVTKYSKKINKLTNKEVGSKPAKYDAVGLSISAGVAVIAGVQVGFDIVGINNSSSSEDKGDVNLYFTYGTGLGVSWPYGISASLTGLKFNFNENHPDAKDGLTSASFAGPSFQTSVGFLYMQTEVTSYGNEPSNDCIFGCEDEVLYTAKGGGTGVGATRMALQSTFLKTLVEGSSNNSNSSSSSTDSDYDFSVK